MMGILGGLTALIAFFCSSLLQTYTNFSVDNSMIKTLYTVPQDAIAKAATTPSEFKTNKKRIYF